MTRIFHIATSTDWAAARTDGRYTTSTRGRTLAEEGFLHASRGDQWEGVRDRFYADITEPLVLLVIDTDLLDVPVIEETVGDSDQTFPHIYGALSPDAVVQAIPLGAVTSGPVTPPPLAASVTSVDEPSSTQPNESFSRIFFREMFFNVSLAVIVLVAVAVAALVGIRVDREWGALVGTVVGFGIGLPASIIINRRRNAAEAGRTGRR